MKAGGLFVKGLEEWRTLNSFIRTHLTTDHIGYSAPLSGLFQLERLLFVSFDDLVSVDFACALWTGWRFEIEHVGRLCDRSTWLDLPLLVVKATLVLEPDEWLIAFLGVWLEVWLNFLIFTLSLHNIHLLFLSWTYGRLIIQPMKQVISLFGWSSPLVHTLCFQPLSWLDISHHLDVPLIRNFLLFPSQLLFDDLTTLLNLCWTHLDTRFRIVQWIFTCSAVVNTRGLVVSKPHVFDSQGWITWMALFILFLEVLSPECILQ